MKNKFIERVIDFEAKRQNNGIELIASENYVSKDFVDADKRECSKSYE